MRIMFLGTPEISAICLDRLLADGHNVVAVVTGEDKPRGRGNVMTPTPVKLLAAEHGIPVYTPATLRDGAFAEYLVIPQENVRRCEKGISEEMYLTSPSLQHPK